MQQFRARQLVFSAQTYLSLDLQMTQTWDEWLTEQMGGLQAGETG